MKDKIIKNRIWLNNKFDKPRSSIRDKLGRIIPKVQRCKRCGRKLKFHHFLCNKCKNEK